MSLYLDSGYVDWEYIYQRSNPFCFLIGGRGTGKTYGGLLEAVKRYRKTGEEFIFMRRTQKQLDMVTRPAYNPFRPINNKEKWSCPYVGFYPEGLGLYGIYDLYHQDDAKTPETGDRLGYGLALSTISNLRGFDASGVGSIIFDEIIPEEHERKIQFEGTAFLNAYETINRNRELDGIPPVKAFLLANSNALYSPILIELELVSTISKMLKKGLYENHFENRGISIYLLNNSLISKQKKSTALYKVAGKNYSDMAIYNTFASLDNPYIKSENLTQYIAVGTINGLTIYRHKGLYRYYVSPHKSGNPKQYPYTKSGIASFKREMLDLRVALYENNVYFENELCHALLTSLGFV